MWIFAIFWEKRVLSFPPGRWCKFIFKRNVIATIKVEASLFRLRVNKFLYDLALQIHALHCTYLDIRPHFLPPAWRWDRDRFSSLLVAKQKFIQRPYETDAILRNAENSRFFQRLSCHEECELVISVIRLCPATRNSPHSTRLLVTLASNDEPTPVSRFDEAWIT